MVPRGDCRRGRRVGRRSGALVGPVWFPRTRRLTKPTDRCAAVPASRRVAHTLGPEGIRGGLVIVRVAVAALAGQRLAGQIWRGPLASRAGGSRQLAKRETARTPGPATEEAPSGRKAPHETEDASRAERASASSSSPIAVIEGDGRVKVARCFAPATRRQRPSNQDPPGSRVLLGGSWPLWAPITSALQRLERRSLSGRAAAAQAGPIS